VAGTVTWLFSSDRISVLRDPMTVLGTANIIDSGLFITGRESCC